MFVDGNVIVDAIVMPCDDDDKRDITGNNQVQPQP